MAKTYTLDEAAGRLGIPLEEFKRRWKTEWTTVRTFRDGGTVRFRSADIDELARTLGMASEPDLQLAPPAAPGKPSSEFLLPDDSDMGDDIFSVDASDSAKKRAKASNPADSDIRIEADSGKSARRKAPADSTPTEELSIDLGPPSSSTKKKAAAGPSSAKLTAPKAGPNISGPPSSMKLNKKKESDSSSEFELSLDSDSDSFELNITPDGSDEVDLGGSRIGKAAAGQSGINLEKPSDSGVSLELDSDSDELSLAPPPSSRRNLAGPKSAKMTKGAPVNDSDSEFELTLDDNSGVTDSLAADAEKGDIFETDFELPASTEDADSGSEVVAVENADTDLENSDFDLALDESDIQAEDESASQVVLLDDEGSDESPKAKSGKIKKLSGGRRPADDDEAIDLDDDASNALRNVPKRRRDEDDEEDVDPSRAAAAAKPKPWGALPAAVLLPAFILTFLGGLMSYELVRGMWSYNNGSKPTGTLVRTVAGWFDMDPKD